MNRQTWPWKKKKSEKVVTAADPVKVASCSLGYNQGNQDNGNIMDFVQISAESHKYLTGLGEQVRLLTENLSSAQEEITTKDNLVKQHVKVAEEAVSGWEKAEAEAEALRHKLESITLLKLTAEERASHLDGTLKECMNQIRVQREDNERKLHDTVFTKTKQWEKVKFELEEKIFKFEQEILRASAGNAALSRSLEERTDMLVKIREDKSQADAQIEYLKADIQAYEKEISSLRYELQVISKELEIRNEEKNMSMRVAEVANKQHLEDVRKISKLEAECQRLRGLMRKKLPGPAALAQMKQEVEILGQDHRDNKLQRSPAKCSSPRLVSSSEFSLQNIHQFRRDNECLTARLLTMEEETKMLNEALSKRNIELQALRDMYAKAVHKLRNIEAHVLVMNQPTSPLKPSNTISLGWSLSQNDCNLSSLASMSEDGIEEVGSCSESWATTSLSEISGFKKERDISRSLKDESPCHPELKDDFLAMKKLSCLISDTNRNACSDNIQDKMISDNNDNALLVDDQKEGSKGEQIIPKPSKVLPSFYEEKHTFKMELQRKGVLLSELRSKIASILESQAVDNDVGSLLEDIRHILQDTQEVSHQHPVGCTTEETRSNNSACEQEHHPEDIAENADSGILLRQGTSSCSAAKHAISEELENAITQIHLFVVSHGKAAMEVQGQSFNDHGRGEKIEEFAASVGKVLSKEQTLDKFILALSDALSEVGKQSYEGSDGESNNDCIDKQTLLEKKMAQRELKKERCSGDIVCSSSAIDIKNDQEVIVTNFEQKAILQKFSLEDFEQLKLEKDSMEMALVRCTETLDKKELHLVETEKNLEELKSQLAACQKCNSLAETRLKCMAESYKSLESRSQELEAEINQLHSKVETLNIELQEEKCSHQDELAKYKYLQEQIERNERCSRCMDHLDANTDITKQQREIAAAAEKLAECQETIILLSRQLKALHPSAESMNTPHSGGYRIVDILLDDEPASGVMLNSEHPDQAEMDNVGTTNLLTRGDLLTRGETRSDRYKSNSSLNNTEHCLNANSSSGLKHLHAKQRSRTVSVSSFSKFFSRRKNDDGLPEDFNVINNDDGCGRSITKVI